MFDVNDPFMVPTLFGVELLIVLAVLVWIHRDRPER
jgi:hypothetical protein